MKRLVLATCVIFGALTVYAQQHTSSALLATGREATTDSSFSPVYTDGKCRFRLKMVANQRYVDRGYTFYGDGTDPVGWGFGFGCNAGASQSDVYDQIAAKPIGGKWIDLDFNEPFKPKQKFKLIKFAGENWTGIGTAVDQIYYAEPERRSRFFSFCLVENGGPQVLCGRTQIRGVTQPVSASKLPKIMAVLKTIEFVDAPAAPAKSASSTTGH